MNNEVDSLRYKPDTASTMPMSISTPMESGFIEAKDGIDIVGTGLIGSGRSCWKIVASSIIDPVLRWEKYRKKEET